MIRIFENFSVWGLNPEAQMCLPEKITVDVPELLVPFVQLMMTYRVDLVSMWMSQRNFQVTVCAL